MVFIFIGMGTSSATFSTHSAPAVLRANPESMPVCQRFFYLSSPVLRSAGSRVCGEERQGMMLGAIALAETASNTCAPLLFNSARARPRACRY